MSDDADEHAIDRPVRRAGTGSTASGDLVTWVVAEGRRGRRWREVVTGPGGVRHSLLLETAPDGTFLHLELATPGGLVSLHPEPDGTLHGNVVTDAGVAHVLGLPWHPRGVVEVEGSPIAVAAVARLVAGESAADGPMLVTRLRISADLALALDDDGLEHIDGSTWRFEGGEPVTVDTEGLPRLPEGRTWPLEPAD